jgi:hypothetical protein
MHTRREVAVIMTAMPLLTADAVAQAPVDRRIGLFILAAERLENPLNVRQYYATLSYYIQLLERGPLRSRPQDIAAANRTYQLVGEAIARTNAKFEGAQAPFRSSLPEAFWSLEREFVDVLAQVGVDPRSLARAVIEESLASMMLFYGAATNVTNVTEMLWCCFPFCFRRPT